MLILPAIDLFEGKAVRLLRGDYSQMTVYDNEPLNTALKFKSQGAEWLHIVDLEGARSGETPNFETVIKIKHESGLSCEIGGGVRDINVVEKYINSGIDRVILGTAAVINTEFVLDAVKNFGDKIAVGIDVKDNFVAVKGWTESANIKLDEFLDKMRGLGVKTFICTDISRDGAMKGANIDFYKGILALSVSPSLSAVAGISPTLPAFGHLPYEGRQGGDLAVNLIASGGVSTLNDIKDLAELKIYGAIIGKALYTGDILLKDALETAKAEGE